MINLPLLDRPLTVGFVWGLITGDWASSLGVCLFFELLWLDIFPAGTIIPPHSLAPALASLCVLYLSGLQQPALAAVVMLAALPFARVFSMLERYHRQYENHASERLDAWTRRGSGVPGPASLTRRSILVMLPLNMVAFALALSGLLVFTHLMLPRLLPLLGAVPLKWPHLWVVASIGAVLSLRHRPAYAVLLCGVALAIVSRLLF